MQDGPRPLTAGVGGATVVVAVADEGKNVVVGSVDDPGVVKARIGTANHCRAERAVFGHEPGREIDGYLFIGFAVTDEDRHGWRDGAGRVFLEDAPDDGHGAWVSADELVGRDRLVAGDGRVDALGFDAWDVRDCGWRRLGDGLGQWRLFIGSSPCMATSWLW